MELLPQEHTHLIEVRAEEQAGLLSDEFKHSEGLMLRGGWIGRKLDEEKCNALEAALNRYELPYHKVESAADRPHTFVEPSRVHLLGDHLRLVFQNHEESLDLSDISAICFWILCDGELSDEAQAALSSQENTKKKSRSKKEVNQIASLLDSIDPAEFGKYSRERTALNQIGTGNAKALLAIVGSTDSSKIIQLRIGSLFPDYAFEQDNNSHDSFFAFLDELAELSNPKIWNEGFSHAWKEKDFSLLKLRDSYEYRLRLQWLRELIENDWWVKQ